MKYEEIEEYYNEIKYIRGIWKLYKRLEGMRKVYAVDKMKHTIDFKISVSDIPEDNMFVTDFTAELPKRISDKVSEKVLEIMEKATFEWFEDLKLDFERNFNSSATTIDTIINSNSSTQN